MPSYRAISLSNHHSNLLLCTERECKQILGPLDKFQNRQIKETIPFSEAVEPFSEKNFWNNEIDNEMSDNDKKVELSIAQHIGVIKSPRDLLLLPNDVRSDIRKVFKSEFLFVKILNERKSNNKR